MEKDLMKKAIDKMLDMSECESYSCNRMDAYKNLYIASAIALQEKIDRENPQPLTLEQLREREGKPVYLITTGRVGYWGIVRTALVYGDENNLCIVCDRNFTFTLDNIEVYDHEPKGVD